MVILSLNDNFDVSSSNISVESVGSNGLSLSSFELRFSVFDRCFPLAYFFVNIGDLPALTDKSELAKDKHYLLHIDDSVRSFRLTSPV
jgi:hypothetical protein